MAIHKTKLVLVLLILVIAVSSTVAAVKTFHVQETDLVKIKAEAVDPDNDDILYYYSPPLDIFGEWQTTFDDAGEYPILITASDGINQTKKEILLIVENKNRPPNLAENKIIVKEVEKAVLNLLEKDLDGDLLTYSFDKIFDENGEWQTDFNDSGSYVIEVFISDGESITKEKLEVIVENVDRALILNLPDKLEVKEGEELLWIIDTFDPDEDSITVSFENAPEGIVFDQETKTFSWTPNYDFIRRRGGLLSDLLNTLRLENKILKVKTTTMKVTSCSNELCVSGSLPLIVYNTNRKPVFEEMLNATVTEMEELYLSPNVVDPDGDIVRVSFSEPLGKVTGKWKTNIDDSGVYTVYVAATDGSATETIPVEVNVLNKNRRPSFEIKKDEFVVNEGEEFNFKFDTFDPDDDDLNVWVDNLPEGTSLENGTFIWTPDFDTAKSTVKSWTETLFSSNDYLNRRFNPNEEEIWLDFVVSDGEFDVVHPVKVTVKNVNQEPEIIDYLPLEIVSAKVGEPVVFHLSAKDEDELDYEWNFGIREKKIFGTDSVERTFVAPGEKKVKVTVSDGLEKVEKEWIVEVLEEEVEEFSKPSVTKEIKEPVTFRTYVIRG